MDEVTRAALTGAAYMMRARAALRRAAGDLESAKTRQAYADSLELLLGFVPALEGLVCAIADTDPIYEDPDIGPLCSFCMARQSYYGAFTPHAVSCLWVQAHALLPPSSSTEA